MTSSIVWRTGALGDFILTIPVLDRFAMAGPVTLVAPNRYRPLFPAAAGWIDSDGIAVTRWLAGHPPDQRFDLALGWTETARDALRAIADEVWLGTPRPPPGEHAADHLWKPLIPLWGARTVAPRVVPPLGAASLHAGAVAIAPGAGGAARRWPLARWQRVAAALPRVVWVGGPIEADEAWPTPRVDPPDPSSLARLASEVAVWLGPDSGPSHLAAAVGTPTGVVFTGASDPRSWAPIGAHVFTDEDAVIGFARDVLDRGR